MLPSLSEIAAEGGSDLLPVIFDGGFVSSLDFPRDFTTLGE